MADRSNRIKNLAVGIAAHIQVAEAVSFSPRYPVRYLFPNCHGTNLNLYLHLSHRIIKLVAFIPPPNLFLVISQSTAELSAGQQYGFFLATGAVSCNSLQPTDYEIILIANTSATYALEPGLVYHLHGKLIAPNDGTAPLFYYYPELLVTCSKASDFLGDLINKSYVQSSGIVKRLERETTNINGNPENNVLAFLSHNDWDQKQRGLRQFELKYRIPGRRNLINAQALFEVGREFILFGFICGWDLEAKMPIIEVLSLTWNNPPANGRSTPSLPPSANTSPTRPGRQFVRFSQPAATATVLPAPHGNLEAIPHNEPNPSPEPSDATAQDEGTSTAPINPTSPSPAAGPSKRPIKVLPSPATKKKRE